ncbi:MAG: hypothetical protein AAGI34_07400 [Pseudomonadota bacterium]
MLSLIKELPDWALGSALAAGLWTGVCYTVLATRALEAEARERLAPACLSLLDADEEARIDAARAEHAEAQARTRAALDKARRKLVAAEQLDGLMEESGLGALFGGLGVAVPATAQSVEVLRARIAAAERQLTLPPDLAGVSLPSAEKARLCRCAALDALAGQRTTTALSLAAFRLIGPAELGAVTGSVRGIVRSGVCQGAAQ